MNQFEKAKAKYEKNRLAQERPLPKVEIKKEAPKIEKNKPMVVSIEGPENMVFEIDYAGALLAGQLTKDSLVGMFTKQLSAFGRVRCR